jgi:acetylornithine aminotransferase/acetylornithine/N-succinyldiaminopimelate aminotransferase
LDKEKMDKWQELEAKYFMRTVKRLPVTLVRGKGCRVWDSSGRKYLDFVGGWAVNSLGHCHPVLSKAIKDQADRLIQASNQYYTVPQVELAELLVKNSCLERVFFCNSGAEANEGATKLARRYGKLNLKGAYEIITTNSSFHGRTLAMVAATGQHKFQDPYIPLPDGFVNVEYDSIEAIRSAVSDKTCAVMLEPIQGEGGVNVPADDYLKKVRALCDEKGLLLILDEVQTGLGRIGSLFGYQQYGVEPDIMTLAKGLGSGVPVGALMAKERASVFQPGEHGSTFGGNPLACAAAVAVVKFIIENDIPAKVMKLGGYFTTELLKMKQEFAFITEVRGRGLLLALEFNSDIGEAVTNACMERQLLVNRVKPNALRFIPPLIVTRAEIDEGLGILREVLEKWQAEKK